MDCSPLHAGCFEPLKVGGSDYQGRCHQVLHAMVGDLLDRVVADREEEDRWPARLQLQVGSAVRHHCCPPVMRTAPCSIRLSMPHCCSHECTRALFLMEWMIPVVAGMLFAPSPPHPSLMSSTWWPGIAYLRSCASWGAAPTSTASKPAAAPSRPHCWPSRSTWRSQQLQTAAGKQAVQVCALRNTISSPAKQVAS